MKTFAFVLKGCFEKGAKEEEECGFCQKKFQTNIEKSSGGKILERADQRVFSMFSFYPTTW